MKEKILIAGGTGFIGKRLIPFLANQGYSLHVLTRRKNLQPIGEERYFHWDVQQEQIDMDAFEGVNTLINLTGAGIGDRRWTERRKKEIIDSRVKSLELLYQSIQQRKFPVKTLLSASGVGYYGAETSITIFNEEGLPGRDFLASVCQKWEEAAQKFSSLGMRTVILRQGVVLGTEGGIYKRLAPLAKNGINVSVGSGRQFLPWVDIRDLLRIYEFMIRNVELNGIFNVAASEHISMNDFSKTLLTSFNKTSFLPNAPAWLMKIMYGVMANMLLHGSRVNNQKIKETGFQFDFDNLEASLSSPS